MVRSKTDVSEGKKNSLRLRERERAPKAARKAGRGRDHALSARRSQGKHRLINSGLNSS